MTNRDNLRAVLHFEKYDHLPVAHFGWWGELLDKWVEEGHLSREEASGVWDGSPKEKALGAKLGFDFNYYTTWGGNGGLCPGFESRVIKEFPDGSRHIMDGNGAITLWRPGATGIPAEIGHTLVDRPSWEKEFLPKLQWRDDRVDEAGARRIAREAAARTEPLGLHLGSLFGDLRNWMGIEGISYLYADDEDLYDEIIQVNADIRLKVVERIIAVVEDELKKTGAPGKNAGDVFDFGHFWEDIAFRNGPLVSPGVFYEKVGPQYRRFRDLLTPHGIDCVSLDCDGDPTSLIPTWLENGVNVMFPIEVGVWDGSFGPWREKFGRELRGVGGMNKHVLAEDRAAIDREIERLRPIVEMGGYLPCPDHRLPPTAVWENVQYYCEALRKAFR